MSEDYIPTEEDYSYMDALREKIQLQNAKRQIEYAIKIAYLNERGITGILNNVRFTRNIDGVNVTGEIEIDARGRFRYNETVHTSIVERVYKENEQWFVKTHYSLYQVNFVADVAIPEKFLKV